MRMKLTKRVCTILEPEHLTREEIFWDEDGTGLGVRVTKPRGDGSRGRYFVFGYRTRIRPGQTPRKSRWRIYSLGRVGRWTLTQAKEEVIRLNALVNEGADPVEDRRQARRQASSAQSMTELAVMVMERHHGTTWEEPPPVGRKKAEEKYVREDRSRWQRHVLPQIGSLLIAEVYTNDVDGVLQMVAETSGKTTANRVRSMLSKAFNLAEVWKLRPQNSNPVDHAIKNAEQRRQRILSTHELVRVLDAIDALLGEMEQRPTETAQEKRSVLSLQRQLLAIALAAETMCRPDELYKCRWPWIQMEKRIVALPKTKSDRRGQQVKGQTFGLSDRAVEILEMAKALSDGSRFLFPSIRSDGRGHISTVKRAWAEILKRAEIEDHPDLYTLKHTMISLSEDAGVQLGGVRDQAGHKDIRTTEIYRHGTDRQKVSTANSLSAYVQGLRRTSRDREPWLPERDKGQVPEDLRPGK